MFKDENKPSFLTVGTPQCAAFCGFMGLLLAVLLLTIGFWRTLMLAVFMLAGLFIGGVKDKLHFVQEKLSGLLPGGEKKPYTPTVPAGGFPKKKASKAEETVKEEDGAAEEDGETEEEADEADEEEETAPEDGAPEAGEGPDGETDAEEPEDEEDPEDAEDAGDGEEEEEEEDSPWKSGPQTRDGRREHSSGKAE